MGCLFDDDLEYFEDLQNQCNKSKNGLILTNELSADLDLKLADLHTCIGSKITKTNNSWSTISLFIINQENNDMTMSGIGIIVEKIKKDAYELLNIHMHLESRLSRINAEDKYNLKYI